MAIITISRGTKSGGEELAGRLADRLGYKTINREVISECARKYNIMEQDLLEELEHTPGLWHKLTREYSRQLIYIKCTLLEMVKDDDIIYYGHAGQLLLGGLDNVLKLRLETPIEDRINAVMKETKKSHDEALEYIKHLDEQRLRWVKLLYDEDWRNPSLYDLSVNLQNMSLATICDIVETAVKSDDFKTTELTKKHLANVSLACEVKAAIAADDKVWDQPITISAEDGIIVLKGQAKNDKLRQLIIETASQVKGVSKCDVTIGLLSDPVKLGKYDHK
jgi:cytidylate kinase